MTLRTPSLTPSTVPTASKPAPIRIACLLNSASERSNLAFLREGAVPTLAERKSIYEDLDNLEVEIQRVDDEITRLQALREQIRAQLALSRAMVAPVRRLPPELLALIFLEHADEFPEDERTLITTITVASVSATWRWVACNVPELWTHISLAPTAASTYPHLELCLSRSGSSLLHVHGEQALGTALKAQITRLLPEAHRWKTLSLHHDYLYELPGILTCALPCLERAVVRIPVLRRHRSEPDVKHLVLDFLADAPRLRDLTLWAYEFREQFVLTLPPSCALTTLSLKSSTYDLRCVMPFIRQCSGTLRHLSLHLSNRCASESAFQSERRIEMPQLTSLDIGRDACRLLSCLSMPRLVAITMRCGADSLDPMLELFAEGGASPRTIRDLFLTNLPNSTHLPFSDVRIVRSLLHFLQIAQDLRTFTMDLGPGGSISTNTVVSVRRVVYRIVSLGLLPNLTEITIRTGGHSAPSRLRRLVREMMHARAAPSTINGRDVVVLERVVTDFDYASEAEQEVDG
ncbi:hypothetical protein EV715DRAFT_290429 [Schizophyllum commune]